MADINIYPESPCERANTGYHFEKPIWPPVRDRKSQGLVRGRSGRGLQQCFTYMERHCCGCDFSTGFMVSGQEISSTNKTTASQNVVEAPKRQEQHIASHRSGICLLTVASKSSTEAPWDVYMVIFVHHHCGLPILNIKWFVGQIEQISQASGNGSQ